MIDRTWRLTHSPTTNAWHIFEEGTHRYIACITTVRMTMTDPAGDGHLQVGEEPVPDAHAVALTIAKAPKIAKALRRMTLDMLADGHGHRGCVREARALLAELERAS